MDKLSAEAKTRRREADRARKKKAWAALRKKPAAHKRVLRVRRENRKGESTERKLLKYVARKLSKKRKSLAK